MEEEDATEEAEEVGGEQREVDGSGAGHLHHDRHEAVQSEHAQNVDCKQHGCKTTNQRQGFLQGRLEHSAMTLMT